MKIVNKRILGALFFTVAFFLTHNIQSVQIDTRFESATGDVNKAYVFINQQTMNQSDYAYGNVEFRGGILPGYTGAGSVNFDLGMTPPVAGPLDSGPTQGSTPGTGSTNARYRIDSALTLDGVSFTGPANQEWNIAFSFQTSTTVFLKSDLILNGLPTSPLALSFVANTGHPGFIDGLGNKIIIGQNSSIGLNVAAPITFKNVKFILEALVPIGANGTVIMRDVEIISQMGQTAFLYNAVYNFIGTHNILGYSGTILFVNNTLSGNQVKIGSQSRVTVAPGTTIGLGLGETYAAPILQFADETSELYLDNCTIDHSPQPNPETLVLTKGTIYINGNVNFISGNGSGNFQLGDGVNQANNVNLIILPGSKLMVGPGVTLTNANV